MLPACTFIYRCAQTWWKERVCMSSGTIYLSVCISKASRGLGSKLLWACGWWEISTLVNHHVQKCFRSVCRRSVAKTNLLKPRLIVLSCNEISKRFLYKNCKEWHQQVSWRALRFLNVEFLLSWPLEISLSILDAEASYKVGIEWKVMSCLWFSEAFNGA